MTFHEERRLISNILEQFLFFFNLIFVSFFIFFKQISYKKTLWYGRELHQSYINVKQIVNIFIHLPLIF